MNGAALGISPSYYAALTGYASQFGIVPTCLIQIDLPLLLGESGRLPQKFFQPCESLGFHGVAPPDSSWRSHSLATCQSLSTVRSDTPRTNAVSTTVIPAKTRNSTT